MSLDYSEKNKLKIDMKDYIDSMIEEFSHEIKIQTVTPWSDKLFKVNNSVKKLDETRKATFHTYTMKAMLLCKGERLDVELAVIFLSTRTRKNEESDWLKMLHMMRFLKGTRNYILTLEVNDSQTLYWYNDATFAVHPDMKSHTGFFHNGKRCENERIN